MPAYNAANFVSRAIESVLGQGYTHWELLIVDDGSTDQTALRIEDFDDPRIHYIYQENQGVSAARNAALGRMQGDFFCFLDADDCFPQDALQIQVNYMLQHPECTLLGGCVRVMNSDLSENIRMFQPTFRGKPLKEYIRLSQSCFFSVTGFVRRMPDHNYRFQEKLTHGEDLLFYIELASNPDTCFHTITDETYIYRSSRNSAMSNLDGLSKGYETLYRHIRKNRYGNAFDLYVLKSKIFKVMLLSYLKKREYLQAFKTVKLLFL
jgi:glycosyltransferase involved in cell wall biosynthesis